MTKRAHKGHQGGSVKICIDCKHVRIVETVPECAAPQNVKSSLVDGQSVPREWRFCATHRNQPATWVKDICGTEGRWFEPAAGSAADAVADAEPPKPARKWWEFWR